jgi:hypothetical protein
MGSRLASRPVEADVFWIPDYAAYSIGCFDSTEWHEYVDENDLVNGDLKPVKVRKGSTAWPLRLRSALVTRIFEMIEGSDGSNPGEKQRNARGMKWLRDLHWDYVWSPERGVEYSDWRHRDQHHAS